MWTITPSLETNVQHDERRAGGETPGPSGRTGTAVAAPRVRGAGGVWAEASVAALGTARRQL